MPLSRTVAALFVLAASVLAAPARRAEERQRPILFVPGNGDSAALWVTTIWRFESNGYDKALLSAIDFSHPLSRSDDTVAQENRSSTEDAKAELSAAVDRVLAATGQDRIVLVGSSRGG